MVREIISTSRAQSNGLAIQASASLQQDRGDNVGCIVNELLLVVVD